MEQKLYLKSETKVARSRDITIVKRLFISILIAGLIIMLTFFFNIGNVKSKFSKTDRPAKWEQIQKAEK